MDGLFLGECLAQPIFRASIVDVLEELAKAGAHA